MAEYIALYDIHTHSGEIKKIIIRRDSLIEVREPFYLNKDRPNGTIAMQLFQGITDETITLHAPIRFKEWFWKQYEWLCEQLASTCAPHPYEGEKNND